MNGWMVFRWNSWNEGKVAMHGVEPAEAEYVVHNARLPYPEHREDDKWLVCGQTAGGRFLQVIYVRDSDGAIYIIHARPLTDREKRRYRRRRR